MISYMSIIYEVQVKFPTVFSRKPQRFTYDFSWPPWDSYFSWHVCCVCTGAEEEADQDRHRTGRGGHLDSRNSL